MCTENPCSCRGWTVCACNWHAGSSCPRPETIQPVKFERSGLERCMVGQRQMYNTGRGQQRITSLHNTPGVHPTSSVIFAVCTRENANCKHSPLYKYTASELCRPNIAPEPDLWPDAICMIASNSDCLAEEQHTAPDNMYTLADFLQTPGSPRIGAPFNTSRPGTGTCSFTKPPRPSHCQALHKTCAAKVGPSVNEAAAPAAGAPSGCSTSQLEAHSTRLSSSCGELLHSPQPRVRGLCSRRPK